MRILQITAGAAQMYCGSCLRDNALAAELMRRGHDVVLVPMYTPTLTDEPNVSRGRVFFGGISVYLEQHSPLFRRTPRWLDRLWDSPLALRLASRRSLSTSPKLLGELTVSMLRGEDGNQRKELGKMLDWLTHEPPFDLVGLPNTLLIGLAKPIREALKRPVFCTMQGEDLFLEGLPEPYRSESKRLVSESVGHVDGFVAVSRFYADFMPGYLGIPREKVRVVPLGINPRGFEPRARRERGGPFTVGYFARVAPEKGLHVLAEAYKLLRESGRVPAARLEAAGYLGAEHKGYLDDIERRMKDWGLAGEFRYRGALDREQKIEFLRGLDVLSVPATYDEPKGISLLEAMACGVPVVQPRRGAFTEIVEDTGGGLLVEPDSPSALAEALGRCGETALARRLGAAGSEGVRRHYTVEHMADRALEVYEGFLNGGAKEAPERARAGAV
ncbi:MAG TPA: glycosyltransferase family 4 protein [Pyrinomonadaceae bacterium]|nr:glycosyltransferase family 4 protein [Pyrinomonadaceae bacterium]